MVKISFTFTVLFEDPFWRGVYERSCGLKYEICKLTFGSEPKDYEIYKFLIENVGEFKFYETISDERVSEKHINPKRMQRKICKQIDQTSIGTKAQKALKQQYEENKVCKKNIIKNIKREEKERKYNQKQLSNKGKRKGH